MRGNLCEEDPSGGVLKGTSGETEGVVFIFLVSVCPGLVITLVARMLGTVKPGIRLGCGPQMETETVVSPCFVGWDLLLAWSSPGSPEAPPGLLSRCCGYSSFLPFSFHFYALF